MLVHLPRLDDQWLDQPVGQFTMHATTDRVGVHQLTDSPDDADIILFTQCHMLRDWRLRRLRDHPLRRFHGGKVLVYNEFDRPWCALPGVYVSMPQRYFVGRYQRPWGYFVPPPTAVTEAPDLLFSFVASNTTRCRRPLFTLRHPDAIVEEVHGFRVWDSTSENFQQRRAWFQAVLARSRFVLCPRGNATSSLRLYEALAAGAVPVIIADDWIAPSGPAWERFSVRWPEGRVDGLLEMLEARAADWPVMSREARRAYDEYFSPDVYFHHVASLCGELLQSSATSGFPADGVTGRRYAELTAENALARARYVRGAAGARTRRVLSRRRSR